MIAILHAAREEPKKLEAVLPTVKKFKDFCLTVGSTGWKAHNCFYISFQDFYCEKIRVFKAGLCSDTLPEENRFTPEEKYVCSLAFLDRTYTEASFTYQSPWRYRLWNPSDIRPVPKHITSAAVKQLKTKVLKGIIGVPFLSSLELPVALFINANITYDSQLRNQGRWVHSQSLRAVKIFVVADCV